MTRSRLLAFLVLSVVSVGCGKANVTRLPTGGTRIVCDRGMKLCVSRADKLCGDDGYTIISGATRKHLLGGSSSSYREMAEAAELTVLCGSAPPPAAEETKYVALPPRNDEPAVSAQAGACIPGATQLCVGPGACQGGQVCAADGSGFGPCDCGGSAASAPTAPATSPAPTGSAPTAAPSQPVPGALPPATPLQ